jgi:hypothetical protein
MTTLYSARGIGPMEERTYHYSLLHKLNYIPGTIFILFFLALVIVLPSTTKIYGYVVFICLLILHSVLVFIGRKKVANEITINSEGLMAKRFLSSDSVIKWSDIESLRYTGKGLFLISWKLEKYIYAEVVAADSRKIIIRREIIGFNDLIEQIQNRSGRLFQPESAII